MTFYRLARPFTFRLYLNFTWLISLSLWIVGLSGQNGPKRWTASPFNPPAFPLAVRSPYLNTWSFQGNNPFPLSNIWPSIWSSIGVSTGWYASVVVDGHAYKVMGTANVANVTTANQTAAEFTPTRSSFLFAAGPMQINVSFISPIDPTDLVRQSMPFSYLTMLASSLDGNVHSVRMYSDVTGEFIAGDTSQFAEWAADVDDEYIVLSMQLQLQKKYSEVNNIAQDATEFYCFKMINNTVATWAITSDSVNRATAANASTTLGNTMQLPPSLVNKWTTLGIAVDWGEILSTPQPAVWGLGLVRSPSIQYAMQSGIQERYPYFMSTYSNGTQTAKAFLDDFPRSQASAVEFDTRLLAAGYQYSSEYAEILALSARQIMGSIDITISKDGEGNWNTSDVKVFMKNMDGIGSDQSGTTMSVNTVDTLYAAFPAFLYLNPELGGYLLSPLLEYQDSSQYTLAYAARNIGSAYPNATADNILVPHEYGVEESANMLIMTLAYSQRSGNDTLIGRHYILLRKWAAYLVVNAFNVASQNSADYTPDAPPSNRNQTNLSVKGIIGIACMARIAEIAGVTGDSDYFQGTATSYISRWTENAMPSDHSHVSFLFGDSSTTGLIYNLYADKLLQLNLASPTVYQAVTSFYDKSLDQSTYGLSLDSSHTDRTTTNWMMFAACTVNNSVTRDAIVKQIHAYAASSQSNAPFSSSYDPSTGMALISEPGNNSPAVGAIFSLLVLNTTATNGSTITGGTGSSASNQSHADARAIAGGTIGAFMACFVIAFGGMLYVRRRRRHREQYEEERKASPLMLPHDRADFQYTMQVALAVPGIVNLQPQTNKRVGAVLPSPSSTSRPSLVGSSGEGTIPSQTSSTSFRHYTPVELPIYRRLREDVQHLRRELDRMRLDLNDSGDVTPVPSYPG